MQTKESLESSNSAVLSAEEAEQAKVAQRCIMAALDNSRAHRIAVVDESGQLANGIPAVEVPPKVLRMFADMLGRMSQRQPITLVPHKYELSTQEAAMLLSVSRPFIVKELEAGCIPHRKVGTHRRILFEDLMAYRSQSRSNSEAALAELARTAQELKLGY